MKEGWAPIYMDWTKIFYFSLGISLVGKGIAFLYR